MADADHTSEWDDSLPGTPSKSRATSQAKSQSLGQVRDGAGSLLKGKTATMSDVARLAGVSLKTVSRVFNNEPYVARDKRDKIMAVAKEINFQPAIAARGLAGGRSSMIGLMVDEAAGDYVAKVTRELAKACDSAGLHLVIEIVSDPSDRARLERILSSVRFDGVVLPPPLCDSMGLLETLTERGVPIVRIGPSLEYGQADIVTIDDEQAAFDMTSFLIAEGHKDIAFIEGDPEHASAPARKRGYTRALAENKLTYREAYSLPGRYDVASGSDATEALLSQGHKPSAIFAANDEMAVGALHALRARGLRVPEDVSLVGFDDDAFAGLMGPPLTTVRQPIAAMATRAIAVLSGEWAQSKRSKADKSQSGSPHIFPVDIIERQSVRSI